MSDQTSHERSEYVALDHCMVRWTELGAEIAFDDGTGCEAWPHPEEHHYHVIAHRCGYADDVLAYCREHELAHALVAQEFLDAPSVVLWGLAHPAEPDPAGADVLREELVAQVLQRWVRANERPILAGVDWDRLKATFLDYVQRLDKEFIPP